MWCFLLRMNTTLEDASLKLQLLEDSSRLQDIFDLRVDVWERTNPNGFVNHILYPNGWVDELDATALHWAVTNDQNKLIAAARLNLFSNIKGFPYQEAVGHLDLPWNLPFALLSRLVILPEYQGQGFCKRLSTCRLNYCAEHDVAWMQTYITNPKVKKIYNQHGFKVAGQAEMSYHELAKPHTVDVFIKEF